MGKGTTSSGRINESNFGGLDFDKIYKRQADENSEYSNYMIRLYPPKEVKNSVEYLVLIELKEGFRTYILQYQTEDKFLNKIYDPTIYTGYVNILDLNRELLAQNYFVDGEDVPLVDASNGRVAAQKCDCEYEWDVIVNEADLSGTLFATGIVCTCSEVMVISDQGVEGSGGGGIGEVIYDPSNPDGSGGGGSGNENPEDGITRDRVGTVKDIDCDVENYIFYNNECVPLAEYLAEKWEESISISTEFSEDPCASSVKQKLDQNDAAWKMIANFTGEPASADLHFDLNPNLASNNGGRTIKTGNQITIEMNSSLFTSQSSLSITQSMLHEYVHAELFYGSVTSDPNFGLLFDNYADKSQVQHSIMIENYLNSMAIILMEIDNREYDIEYYKAISYRGLEGTSFYKNNIKGTAEEVLIKGLQGTVLSGTPCK